MTFDASGLCARRRARVAAAASLCCLAATSAQSQSLPTAAPDRSADVLVALADPVLVTATRTAQPLSRALADASVLERDAIERSGATCLADLLVRLPGVEIQRNGGPGGTTSVFIRGGESRHTAVYIDGLRVDSQTTAGAAWEMLPVAEIERIEVLRGPAAAVYGSDAIAGVVQLFTKRGAGALQANAAVSVGRFATRQASAGVSGAAGAVDYALSGSAGRSQGFNARPGVATANPDDDGWRRGSLQGRLGWQLATGHRLEAAVLASNLRAQYDGSLKNDDIARNALRTVSLGWQGQWNKDSNTHVQIGQTQATYETQPSYYRTETTLRNVLLQQGQTWGNQHLDLTVERREDALLNPPTAYAAELRGQRHQDALGLGWRIDLGEHALQAFVRHDHDSEFGNKPTGSLAWGWQVLPAWRLMASAATSFRAPTLYQRFSEYGKATLVPESGRNVEMALRWTDAHSSASATLYQNTLRNLIVFGAPGPCASPYGCYDNVGHARYQGLTLAAETRLLGVAVHGSLDYHDPRNQDRDLLLARRARLLATLGADGQWAGWGWGIEAQGAGGRYDDADNAKRMGGYGLLNLRAERSLAAGLTLEARLDNVADKVYETARGYATVGRSAQIGLRWALR